MHTHADITRHADDIIRHTRTHAVPAIMKYKFTEYGRISVIAQTGFFGGGSSGTSAPATGGFGSSDAGGFGGFDGGSTGTYGGMSGGQMVMGSAMGAGGAQFGGGGFGGDFGGSSFGQPQPDFGSQPVGGGFGSQPVGGDFGGGGFGQPQQFGSQDFGGGGFGQPASVGFGASPLTRENQAVVPPPLPPAGLSIPSFFVLDAY